MKWRHALGRLSVRLTLLNLLLFGALSAAIFLVTERVFSQAYHAVAQQSVRQTSRMLNMALALPGATGALDDVKLFFDEMLQDPAQSDLAYLALADDRHQLLITAGDIGAELPAPTENLTDAAILHYRQSILLADNRVGALQFGYRLHELQKSNETARRTAAYLMLAGVICLAGLQIYYARRFARRIAGLTDAAGALAQGNFQYRIADPHHDELAALGRHFNNMATTIEQKVGDLNAATQALQTLNHELESRVLERTREIEDKNQLLYKTLRNLSETQAQLIESEKLSGLGAVVAGVAHELNTPIGNAVMVNTTLGDEIRVMQQELTAGALKKSTLEKFVAANENANTILQRNLERAAHLIQSFKQVAVDQASVQRRSFLLSEMVDELMVTLHPTLKRTRIVIEKNLDPHLQMDSYPGPLGQVLTNLVNNALMHAFAPDEAGTISIVAWPEREEAGWCSLLVVDNGRGMSAEVSRRIFEPFFTTKLGKGGSGLGMHLVWTLVTGLLGGRISVSSAPGEGTQVSLRLPLCAPTSDHRNAQSVQTVQSVQPAQSEQSEQSAHSAGSRVHDES